MRIETKFDVRETVFALYDNKIDEYKVEKIDITVSDVIDAGNWGTDQKHSVYETYYLRDLKDNTREEDTLLVVVNSKLIFKTKQELLNSL